MRQSYVQAKRKFSPHIIQGDDWVRFVAVCETRKSDNEDPFNDDPDTYWVNVVAEYATKGSPDAFGQEGVIWHRMDIDSPIEDYFARIAIEQIEVTA